uniref:Ig-like domain-containing protein n=1 Tax=Mola mola TaxID=94237 RepID=A0A3Q3XBS0_MOLML
TFGRFTHGEGGGVMDFNPDVSDRRATLPGGYDPVVERELRTLGSRPPGLHLDPNNPARQALGGAPSEGGPPVRHLGVEPLIRASHANLARPVQGSEESVSVGSDYYGSMFSLYRGRTFTIRNDTNGGLSPPLLLVRRLQQLHQCSNITPPFPLNPHPSRTQTAVKSQELSPSVPLSSAQQPPSSHKNSITAPNQDLDKVTPSDPQSSKTDRPSSIVMTPKIARAGPKIFDKVCAFEERRASKDLPGGSASGFGRVSSFDSNDSGNKTDGPSKEGGETLQGAAHKRAAFKQRASSLEDKTSYSQRVQSYQSKFAEELQRIKKLMGKPSLKKAYSTEQLSQGDRLTTGKLEPIPPQRASPLTVREPGPQCPPKPPRLTPSPTPSISPLMKRRKAEGGRTSPALKVSIPTILVEDEPMETECGATGASSVGTKTRRKEGKAQKSKKGRSAQHRSPEEVELTRSVSGGWPDDSYLSADEEPAVGPKFKRPIVDTAASSGSEATLECVVTGSPPPTVTWRKNDVEVRSDGVRAVKADGQKHGLLIKRMRPSDAGSYCVTAVNAAGGVSCRSRFSLFVRKLETSSPTQSDEEYLSPQEEAMELRDSLSAIVQPLHITDVTLYKVAPCDQAVTEGQDVVILAQVSGQPQPVVYWSKDRIPVTTAGRFSMRQTDDGTNEMRICSAQRSDTGLYVCKIINEYGTKQAECRVDVRGEQDGPIQPGLTRQGHKSPRIFVPLAAAAAQTTLKITREVNDVAVRAGESAILECHIAGPPDVDVDWLSNGKLIQPALLNCKMHFDGKRCIKKMSFMLNSLGC